MTKTETEPLDEIWICQIPGRIAVGLEDLRTGRVRTIAVEGKGQFLRLTDQQRELVEEQIVHQEVNPFKNGMLVRKRSERERSDQELADDELAAVFELDDADYNEFVDGLTEVNLRRLVVLAKERDASYNQVGALQDAIAERFPAPTPGPTQEEINAIGRE